VRLVIFLTVLAGCFEDRYLCSSDADCNLGEAGRCEIDGLCTVFDKVCDTERRYSPHAGDRADQCFDDHTAIANLCAAGQPPPPPDGCAQDVCTALPACCTSGWSEACVQQAQLRCAISCDTRIAITATNQNRSVIELWEYDWNGSSWRATQHTDREGLLAWVAPAPGELEPRLAGIEVGGASVLVGGALLPAFTDRTYQAITSVDFDRDGRDTIAIAFTSDIARIEVRKLDSSAVREFPTTVAFGLSWGDTDRDAFPDGVAGIGTRYTLLDNIDDASHVRALSGTTSSNVGGGPTTGSPSLRKVDWIDIDGDRTLDLAVFGNQVRVHANADRLNDTPLVAVDCDPLVLNAMCSMTDQPLNSFSGTVLPSVDAQLLFVSTFPARHIYELAVLPGAQIGRVTVADDCPTCLPIIAAVARDLDGDHKLDFIGLDEKLGLYVGLAADGFRIKQQPIALRPTRFFNVLPSVTGAPSP